jgi:hypothetical protein
MSSDERAGTTSPAAGPCVAVRLLPIVHLKVARAESLIRRRRWGRMGMRGKLQSACGGLVIFGALGAGALSGGGIAAAQPVHPSHPHSTTSDAAPSGHVPQHSELAKTSQTVAPTSPPEQSLAERSLDVSAPTPGPITIDEIKAVISRAIEEHDKRITEIRGEIKALTAEREAADPARRAEINARILALMEEIQLLNHNLSQLTESISNIVSFF